jgi:hypothetical protein
MTVTQGLFSMKTTKKVVLLTAVSMALLSAGACIGKGKGKAPPPAPVSAPIVTKG